MMHRVKYLGIAVRQLYQGGGNQSHDFDAFYASNRLVLPLKEVLIIGY